MKGTAMNISIFPRRAAAVAHAPVERIPDHAKARTLIDVSIEKLRTRADFLQANIERDSAELREPDRTLEALLEAKAKVAPDVYDVAFLALDAELALPIDEAAE